MTKKNSYEEVYEEFSERGYQLIEKEYLNNKAKMEYKCPNHPDQTFFICYRDLKRGSGCPKCANIIRANKRRTSFSVVKEAFIERGYTLLTESYSNCFDKLKYKCQKHPEFEFKISYHDLKNGKGCPACAKNRRLTFKEVKEAFTERGYTLLDSKYVRSSHKMQFTCEKHPNEIQVIDWNHFKIGNGCKMCGRERTNASLLKYTLEDAEILSEKLGLRLLSDSYSNIKDKLQFECKNHPGEIQSKTFEHIQRGQGCRHCYRESNIGKGNPNWKGTSELSHYLRGFTEEWKRNILADSNYKCDITGENGDLEVHHLKPFHILRDETLAGLNLEVFETIGEYTDEELKAIVDGIKKRHSLETGVVLLKKIHKKFHHLYGHDVKPSDYYDFKRKIQNGIIKCQSA